MAASPSPPIEEVEKPSFRQRLQSSLGLAPHQLPAALLIHELLGLTLLAGLWGVCYRLQPTKTVLTIPPVAAAVTRLRARFPDSFHRLNQRAERAQSSRWYLRLDSLFHRWRRPNTIRLSTSFGESIVLRRLLAPITIPGKLWVTYHLVTRFC
jgi:hypothetical protein